MQQLKEVLQSTLKRSQNLQKVSKQDADVQFYQIHVSSEYMFMSLAPIPQMMLLPMCTLQLEVESVLWSTYSPLYSLDWSYHSRLKVCGTCQSNII